MPRDTPPPRHRLSKVDLLESLSEEDIEWLSHRTPEVGLQRDQIFYLPGHTFTSAFLLTEGRMRLYKTLEGHELTLDVIEVGSMFGVASLVGRPQWAHCQALEPSKVALLGVNTFRHLVVRNPEVGLKAAQLFVERLYDYESKLADIGLKEVLGRLASLILHMLEREGIVTSEDLRIPRHYTHEELAAMIGAKRVAVTRVFGRLRHAGAVKHDRRGIRIKNRNTLERFAKAV